MSAPDKNNSIWDVATEAAAFVHNVFQHENGENVDTVVSRSGSSSSAGEQLISEENVVVSDADMQTSTIVDLVHKVLKNSELINRRMSSIECKFRKIQDLVAMRKVKGLVNTKTSVKSHDRSSIYSPIRSPSQQGETKVASKALQYFYSRLIRKYHKMAKKAAEKAKDGGKLGKNKRAIIKIDKKHYKRSYHVTFTQLTIDIAQFVISNVDWVKHKELYSGELIGSYPRWSSINEEFQEILKCRLCDTMCQLVPYDLHNGNDHWHFHHALAHCFSAVNRLANNKRRAQEQQAPPTDENSNEAVNVRRGPGRPNKVPRN